MLKLTLLRFSQTTLGTHGVLLSSSGVPMVCTLEEPWRDNARMVSCIPSGSYDVVKYSGTRHKDAFYVKDVPGRSDILIHEGNTLKDTAGCILVGKSYSQYGLDNSLEAMRYLNIVLPRNFILEVKNELAFR